MKRNTATQSPTIDLCREREFQVPHLSHWPNLNLENKLFVSVIIQFTDKRDGSL